jgi:hypothetical protein
MKFVAEENWTPHAHVTFFVQSVSGVIADTAAFAIADFFAADMVGNNVNLVPK